MKNLLVRPLAILTLVCLGFAPSLMACDEASFTFNSEMDNGDGTYTFNIDLCIEFNGLEGSADWFNLVFQGGTFSSVDSYNPTTITTSGGDDYVGAVLSGNSEIRWTFGGFIPLHSGQTLCTNITITTTGRPAEIDISYHDTYGGNCDDLYTLSVPCSIDNVALGTQTACNPATDTYSQEVVVTYTNAPSTGTLDVNGQSFAITTSPQTVNLTGLTADGNAVSGAVSFSDDTGCSSTVNFTAPASCSACSIDNVALGTQSACNPADNTYTQEVTVTYTNPPSTGTLDVNGQSFAVTTSPQTVTLTGLSADGNAVSGTVNFSNDMGCSDTVNFTAPVSCSVGCAADNGTWD